MGTTSAVLFVFIVSLAASYGWAIRGTTLGAEKGAMLPGAMIGLLLACFSGSEIIANNFWLLSAGGAMAMFFGGTETYGQTMGLILKKGPDQRYAKGLCALIIKGGLWFGIYGGFIGMIFSSMTGEIYKTTDFIAFFLILPVVRSLGNRLINKPFKPEEGKFPKIYFSVDRREEWGGLLAILIEIIIFTIIKSDSYALIFALVGTFSGAAGWAIAINFYYITMHPLKNGKYIFGQWQKRGWIDGWKIMEFALGAIGGLGLALCFVYTYPRLAEKIAVIESNGALWSPVSQHENVLPWVVLGLIIVCDIFCGLEFLRRKKKYGKNFSIRLMELLPQPVYSYIPLALVLMGSIKTAQIVSFFVIFWVLVEEIVTDELSGYKYQKLASAALFAVAAIILAGEILLPNSYGALETWIFYNASYTLVQMVFIDFRKDLLKEQRAKFKDKKSFIDSLGSTFTVRGFYVIQATVLIAAGVLLFK